MQLSQDFDSSEFDCKCGCGLSGTQMDTAFIAKLQSVRTAAGFPFRIISGIRCAAHNAAVGGTPNSLHLSGQAADVAFDNAYQLYSLLKIGAAQLNGVGVNNGSVHLDNRLTPMAWTYYNLYTKKS